MISLCTKFGSYSFIRSSDTRGSGSQIFKKTSHDPDHVPFWTL